MSWEWEVGISTGIAYERPIGEVIGPLARAGFRAVEISTAPHHLDVRDRAAVASAADALRSEGLRVVSLHAPFGSDLNFTAPDADQRRRTLDVMTHAADALVRFGGRLYVVHPGGEDQRWTWDRDQRLGYAVEGLRHLWAACRERGLELVVESPLPHLLGGAPDDFDWILQQLPAEGTGVCADTSHLSLGGHLQAFVARFAARLVHVQASDNGGTTDDHLPPGEGCLDWPEVVRALRAARYRGAFLLEVSCGGALEDRARRAAASQARLPSWSALT
jgi:sugar phosphate isomerase/epimerase